MAPSPLFQPYSQLLDCEILHLVHVLCKLFRLQAARGWADDGPLSCHLDLAGPQELLLEEVVQLVPIVPGMPPHEREEQPVTPVLLGVSCRCILLDGDLLGRIEGKPLADL